MDQPGKVANPARGQLNRENILYPVPVLVREYILARQLQPTHPASDCSLSSLRLILVFAHWIPPISVAAPILYRHTLFNVYRYDMTICYFFPDVPVLSTCPIHTQIVGVRKRGAYSLVHGDLPRQHAFQTILRLTDPVPVDSRQ